LARENAKSQQPALETALRQVGWLHKLPLYVYWFDYIERVNHIEAPCIRVIVISNEPEDNTPEAMRRLREQVGDRGEIIFVNNGCNDEVFDSIRPYADIYIRLRANSGAYCARNIGAAFGKANILLFVEDDGVPEEGFIDSHLQIHEDYDVIAVRGVYQPSAGSKAPP